MYLIMPKEIIEIPQLTKTMTAAHVAEFRRQALVHEVDILLPKFEMKSHLGVKEALFSMGVKAAFSDTKADFDKMLVKKDQVFRIYLSEIFHDAWIVVHEEGTEAAAATSTELAAFGDNAPYRPRPAVFHADHPFLFMIVHNASRSILFAGWISNPETIAQQSPAGDVLKAAPEE
jgi:serpin B